jgi:hypothetical protein
MATNRRITRPYSKLNRLCSEAAKCGGRLTTYKAVAEALDLSRGRVTQIFGYPKEKEGAIVKSETVGRLAAAFARDGVVCEIEWLYLDYDEFASRLAAASKARLAPSRSAYPVPPPGQWERREATVLPDLVELRLHPPRPGNEVPDSYYVDATLLFGTALCEHSPDDGGDPRTIAIALKEARLAVGSDGYRPLPGSMRGEQPGSENFRRVAGGIDIVGPAPAGTLDGDPIGSGPLAAIAATHTGDEPFTVAVAALRRSFVVRDAEKPEVPIDNKSVILNEFIYKKCRCKDESGRAVLARATMKRRAEESDPTT